MSDTPERVSVPESRRASMGARLRTWYVGTTSDDMSPSAPRDQAEQAAARKLRDLLADGLQSGPGRRFVAADLRARALDRIDG